MPETFNTSAVHAQFQDLNSMRAFANRMIGYWDRDHGRTFNLKIEYAEATGPVIWAYTNHVVELMRTVLELSKADRMIVAVPLIRLILELTMTSIWIYLEPARVRGVIHESLRQRRAGIKDILELGAEGFSEELLQKVSMEMDEFAADAHPGGRHFEQRCREIVDGLGVYATWRVMSSLSHPGLAMADSYLVEAPRTSANPLGIHFSSNKKLGDREAWLGTAIGMLLASLKVCDLIDADGRRRSQIASGAKKLGISLDFRLVSSA